MYCFAPIPDNEMAVPNGVLDGGIVGVVTPSIIDDAAAQHVH